MSKESLTFGDIKIKKTKNYRHKTLTALKDPDIEKILVSNKISPGEKKTINTLLVTCIMVIKLSHYI